MTEKTPLNSCIRIEQHLLLLVLEDELFQAKGRDWNYLLNRITLNYFSSITFTEEWREASISHLALESRESSFISPRFKRSHSQVWLHKVKFSLRWPLEVWFYLAKIITFKDPDLLELKLLGLVR